VFNNCLQFANTRNFCKAEINEFFNFKHKFSVEKICLVEQTLNAAGFHKITMGLLTFPAFLQKRQ